MLRLSLCGCWLPRFRNGRPAVLHSVVSGSSCCFPLQPHPSTLHAHHSHIGGRRIKRTTRRHAHREAATIIIAIDVQVPPLNYHEVVVTLFQTLDNCRPARELLDDPTLLVLVKSIVSAAHCAICETRPEAFGEVARHLPDLLFALADLDTPVRCTWALSIVPCQRQRCLGKRRRPHIFWRVWRVRGPDFVLVCQLSSV